MFCPFTLPHRLLKSLKNQNFEKTKKIAGDCNILHMCTKNHNHMSYGSWEREWGWQTRKSKFWKNKESIWRCQHFTLVHQKSQSYDICFLRYRVWQTIFCHFVPFFALLPHYRPRNLKFGINVKNVRRYLLRCKQPAHDKGTLDSVYTLLHKALIQGYRVNSDNLG